MKWSHILTIVISGSLCLINVFDLARGVVGHFAARSWVPTEATIVDIKHHPKRSDLTYEYFHAGMKIRGDKFAFLSEGSLAKQEYIQEHFAIGQKITVFVNPSDPKQSVVLRRPLRMIYLWKHLLIGGLFGAFTVYDFRKARSRRLEHGPKSDSGITNPICGVETD